MDIPFVNVVNNHVRVAPTHKHWTSNEWAPLPCGRGNLRLAFLGLIPALKCFGGGKRSRAGLKAALKVTEEAVEKPRWKAKRLRKPTGALRKWGGVGFKIRQDGLAFRPQVFQEEQATKVKWKPKRENWQAWVTDDEGTEAFGPLAVGHEVEFLQGRSRMESAEKWVAGVVTNMSTESGVQQAKLALSTGQTKIVDLRRGLLRRSEDAQELCAEKDIAQMAKLRTLKRPKELMQFGLGQKAVSSRSQAIYSLVRMGRDGIRCAEELLSEVKPWDVSSTAIRELAHSHARMGDVKSAMRHVDVFDEVHSAQLLIEILALGLTGTILKEREKLGSNFLTGVETNPVVQGAVNEVVEFIPKLGDWAEHVRQLPQKTRQQCFAEAFNELLLSCGRAHAVKVSFRVLEWMEALAIPKDAFTYEAIGVNVVKRITRLQKVWDLPQAPEDKVCPEVVFAGRSNVGKSSLVNMLLNWSAIAPTSSRPGRTKTMDFFDVNHGHPALPRFRLVDVPGLGFARVSHELRERWIALIGGYFVQRQSLKVVFHLLDAGLCELMPADRELWRLLAQAKRSDYELCIVLTKADNSVPSQLERFANIIREALRREGSDLAVRAKIFACSAVSKLGKDTLWRKIWSAVGGEASTIEDLGEGPDNAERYRKTEFGWDEPGVSKS